ncbi:MAG: tetratricopeptide repeat protein [Clostridia bacterium]|nr:tetratricopeptide repeat protein [Clostridia bacterium]
MMERLTIRQLADLMYESRKQKRFCFILGSGASVTSGIPMGRTLEKRWMDCLMGKAPDGNSRPKSPDDTEKTARSLYDRKKIETPFEDLKKAWEGCGKPGGHIPSEYYFDVYKLRFWPEQSNGYKYLEDLMDKARPSIGYHPLARLLAEDNGIDVVITTNFDSLVEDSLFIFTEARPIVVAHESLAGFIELSKKQRPVVAKVHRGLFFDPLNERESTSRLSDEWRKVLKKIFGQYTPVVIGYAGGDKSLMSFLEEKETELEGGIYWCLMKGEEPGEKVERLVTEKGGYFVEISGFDDAMLTIGEAFFGKALSIDKTKEYLKANAEKRGEEYERQWNEWEERRQQEKAEHEEGIAKLIEAQVKDENEREARGELTAGDHLRRGNRAYDDGKFEEAMADYNRAIELKSDYAEAYNSRGCLYDDMGEREKAMADYNRAIELKSDYSFAYNNRGCLYDDMGEQEKAMADYNRAIELKPNDADVYNNRGCLYDDMGEQEKAMADYNRAIELKPDFAEAYNNCGNLYDDMGEKAKAMADYNRAIELKPDNAEAYNNRGILYRKMGEQEKAMADFARAAELVKKKK